MSCIKTKEWLEKLLKEKECRAIDIEESLHLEPGVLSPILDGSTFGSIDVWDTLINRYEPVFQSMDSGKVINQLMDELESRSEDEECIVFYEIKQESIFFIDYFMEEDLIFCKDLPEIKDLLQTKMTLGEALNYFQFQNYCRERSKYWIHAEYMDGKIVDETDFMDDVDFDQSMNAYRHCVLNEPPIVKSFQAYIGGTCVEDSTKTEYTVFRREDGRIIGIGLNPKESSKK